MSIKLTLTNLTPGIPRNIKKFDPSYVTRYVIVCELLRQLQQAHKRPLKVLDVGGYNGAARDLLPDMDITIVDLAKDEKLKKYVRVTGAEMPFQDGEFDAVISCDTLEHVPQPQREEFINEILRVSSNYVILGAPFDGRGVAKAEENADMMYQGMTRGESYIWLKEHKEYGLPNRQQMERVLNASGVHYTQFEHAALSLWGHMLRTCFFMANNIAPVSKRIAKKLTEGNAEYIEEFAFKDFPTEGYRTFFVISKKEDVSVSLPKFDAEKEQDMTNRILSLAGECIQGLVEECGSTKDRYNELQIKSQELYEDNKRMLVELQAAQAQLNRLKRTLPYRVAKRVYSLKRPK